MSNKIKLSVSKYLVNFTVFLVSLLAITVILELVFRGLGYSRIFDIYSNQSILWEYDSLLGWRHRKNTKVVYAGPKPFPIEFSNEVRINSNGLRGGEVGRALKDGFRVLVLGDSKVAAFEVNLEDTFIHLLQERLTVEMQRPVQVLNAGVRGYGADQSFLYLVSRGFDLKPDLIVFMPSANDPNDNVTLHRMKRQFGKSAIRFHDDDSYEIINSPVPVYEVCSAYAIDSAYQINRFDTGVNRILCQLNMALLDHSVLASFVLTSINKASVSENERLRWLERLTRPRQGAGTVLAKSNKFQIRHMSLIVKAMSEAAMDRDIGFLLVTQDYLLNQLDEELLQGAPIYSFSVDRKKVKWRNDSHYNIYGHQVVADKIWQPVLTKLHTLEKYNQ